jgi:hypothetical protein
MQYRYFSEWFINNIFTEEEEIKWAMTNWMSTGQKLARQVPVSGTGTY